MVFRRRFRARRRRRRPGPETFTIKECRQCFNIYGRMNCTEPLIDISEVLSMSTPRNASLDATEISNPSSKAILFEGAKFQSLWSHDPNNTQDCSNSNPSQAPNASRIACIVTIWEALMLLPTVQGSTNVPAYLPNLTFPTLQNGDLADRVLWKRLSHLFVQGVNSLAPAFVYNPDSSARYNTESPVVVKTKCRIDDRHALYYVRNIVHNLFFPFTPIACGLIDCDNCDSNNSQPNCGTIPIDQDLWMKVFYRVRG